jgi:Fur family ferric uptake transcriptional regulator
MAGPDPQRRDPREIFRAYLVEHGLKSSRQRDLIVETFLGAQEHLRVEQLLSRVRESDPGVSQATVYRTMKLLVECGLAEARNFEDGQTRYEPGDTDGAHHDHLICTACDTIIEFVDDRIEALQQRVATAHGFVVSHHKMELYGLCAACQAASAST